MVNFASCKYTGLVHEDAIKWKHFPCYWPSVRGIHRSTADSPHIGQWRGAFMFPLIRAWTNGWANNRDNGGLRRRRVNYDVTVMIRDLLKTVSKADTICNLHYCWGHQVLLTWIERTVGQASSAVHEKPCQHWCRHVVALGYFDMGFQSYQSNLWSMTPISIGWCNVYAH